MEYYDVHLKELYLNIDNCLTQRMTIIGIYYFKNIETYILPDKWYHLDMRVILIMIILTLLPIATCQMSFIATIENSLEYI